MLTTILMANSIIGQSHIDLETKWTYTKQDLGSLIIGPAYLEIAADTLVDGVTWYKVIGDPSCSFPNPDSIPLIRELDNKWLVYDINREKESTLYNFNLNEGESYSIDLFGPTSPITVTIDSISTTIIDGESRKVQHIDVVDFGFAVIEGIGSTTYLFPQGNICDPQTGPIRCFENSQSYVALLGGTTQISNWEPERCDEEYFDTSTDDKLKSSIYINLFPNPIFVNQPLSLESNIQVNSVEVFSLDGKRIKNIQNINNPINIDLPGIYIIRINTRQFSANRKLFVVE